MYVTRLTMSGVRGFDGPRAVDIGFPQQPDGSYAGWTVLAGRNGAGKTTLLQSVVLAGAGPSLLTTSAAAESWVSDFQEHRLPPNVSVSFFHRPQYKSGWPESGRLSVEWWVDFGGPGEEAGEGTGKGELEPGWSVTPMPRSRPNRADLGGPWALHPNDWMTLGYGPFRRHSQPDVGLHDLDRPTRESGWRTLFDEDATLVEGVSWLIGQHLRQLEGKEGAAELVAIVLRLLGDGLLPDGFHIVRVDSAGLWVRQADGREMPLRRMSDGYRTVGALVVDIVRRMHASFGTLEIEERDGVPTLPYPGVVLIDEVDAHLHVSWQKKIGGWLKAHFPKIQFIVTTHSPYICQNADPGGLIRLPGPDEPEPPRVVDEDLYHRVVYGSGDDAVLSELFGVETPYSAEAERLRRRLGDLEARVLDGQATEAEVEEFRALRELLTSSLMARVDEVSARLGHER
ncbi:AAA family ATPase [Actinomadura logoneensis]|uniref:AAA family ATPase n=1 Tax=Actinomadura logoneensis TaxID=2293572 RepID=A0A372JNA4_9ACTN|nr:AAA family ATPase [Actinomadura logoneensis]RFU41244.1 AAA family ATPase [Actinomadura logoneensis]